jgi:hypothetical protein
MDGLCSRELFLHSDPAFSATDAQKFKDAFEKCQKGDTKDMAPIKQDAEDAEKAAEKKEEEKK